MSCSTWDSLATLLTGKSWYDNSILKCWLEKFGCLESHAFWLEKDCECQRAKLDVSTALLKEELGCGKYQNPDWNQPSCAQFPLAPGSPRSSKPGLLVPFSPILLPTRPLLSTMRMSGSCPDPLQFQSWNGKNQLCLHNWDLTICPSLLNAGRLESVHAQHGEVSLRHRELSKGGWKALSDSGFVSNWCTLHWNVRFFCCPVISTNQFQNLKQNYV